MVVTSSNTSTSTSTSSTGSTSNSASTSASTPGGISSKSKSAGNIRRRQAIIITSCIFAALAWSVLIITWGHSLLVKPAPAAAQLQMEEGLPVERFIDLWPDDLQHLDFAETLHSCDPDTNSKCKTFVPEGTNGQHRIAVMSPPGGLGFLFEKFIMEVLRVQTPHLNATNIQLIRTSHVPPYGYGKTHGLTKIIRLAVMPLRLAAADLVLERIYNGELSMEDVRYVDIQQALRQIIRWHCRLSHVAAHTSLMTISLEDLVEDPWQSEYQVSRFLNLKPKDYALEQHLMEEQHIDEDEIAGSVDQIVQHAAALLLKIEAVEKLPRKMLEPMLDEVINEELKLTNNLKDWPCLPFWSAGNSATPNDMALIAKHNAKDFSPNCEAEFTNCFVPRDKCEAKGDSICKGSKR